MERRQFLKAAAIVGIPSTAVAYPLKMYSKYHYDELLAFEEIGFYRESKEAAKKFFDRRYPGTRLAKLKVSDNHRRYEFFNDKGYSFITTRSKNVLPHLLADKITNGTAPGISWS